MEQSALTPILLWSFLDQKDKLTGLLAFGCSSTCAKASKIYGKDGGQSGPPITCSTWPFARCDTSLWAWRFQLLGTNSLAFGVTYTFSWGWKMLLESRNLLMEQVSSKPATSFTRRIKQKVRRHYPRPCAVSVTLLWARNLSYDVDSDRGRGSKVYLDKRGAFVGCTQGR